MRIPAPTVQRSCNACTAGAPCPKCAAEKKDSVQRKAEHVSDAPGSVSDSFIRDLGSGQPLPPATRAFFEPRFGYDFSQVRVHTDAPAAESARAVNALAYTVGRNIVFEAGHYAPETNRGRSLLAHELTHVVQQQAMPLRLMRTPYPGCDRRTTGVDDADARLDRARAQALSMVRTARAAFPRMSTSTIRMVDRHFHCPSSSQIRKIMESLANIEAVIPTLEVRCVSATTDFCMESEFVKGRISPDDGVLEICPASFGPEAREYRLGGTFIHGAAITVGLENFCLRRDACYNDFTIPASDMIKNAYSYTWFAIERAGHAVPPPPTIPCAPLHTGIYVYVPPGAVTDPTLIRPVTGFEEIPPGSTIEEVFEDRAGNRFIYHDDLPGAREYLPDGRRRYYFPSPGAP